MIDRYAAKLNKVEGKTYVIEEAVNTVGGVYENELDHDNAEVGTINVYTGSKLTGTKVDNVIISVPGDAPWKRRVRILSSAETVYISYETPGDTVEADDINRVQDGIVRTQEALQEHRDGTQVALDGKVDKVSGKGLSTNDYTAADKGKLAGISAGAQVNTVTSVAGKTGAISLVKGDVGLGNVDNTPDANKPISAATQAALDGKVNNARVLTDVPAGAVFTDTVYTHPPTHSADILVDGTNNKAFTTAEKTKLTGIATGANNYTHPTTAGNKHIPTGGVSGQILRYSASGTAIWGADNDTITTVNGKTGAIAKADIVALGIPAQDTVVDISGKADTTYVDGKVKTDVPVGAKFTDTVYTHPATHPPTIIAQNTTNRFVTDAEKAHWNSKETAGAKTWNDLKGV